MATNTPPSSGKGSLSSYVAVKDLIRRDKGGRAVGRDKGGHKKGALADASVETSKDSPKRDIQRGATRPFAPTADSTLADSDALNSPGIGDRERQWQAVRSRVGAMTGANFVRWDEVVKGAAETEFKNIRPLDYTFVLMDDGSFHGRVEVHFVQTLADQAWPEPFRIGQWLPGRVRGYVDDEGHVRIEHAALARTDC